MEIRPIQKATLKDYTKLANDSIPYLDEVKMRTMTKIVDISSRFIASVLLPLYRRDDALRFIGPLLNASVTEKKCTFYLDFHSMMNLVINDPNYFAKDYSKKLYDELILMIENSCILKILGTHDETGFVLSWNHPGVVRFFEETLGPEKVEEQKLHVLQWVKENSSFEEDLPPLPKLNDQESFNDESLSSLELAKRKAMSYGIMKKSELKRELDQAVQRYHHESKKYQVMVDQAKKEDLKRLDSDNEQQAVSVAVKAGIQAQKQKKLVMDLEDKLLLLRQKYEEKQGPMDKLRDLTL